MQNVPQSEPRPVTGSLSSPTTSQASKGRARLSANRMMKHLLDSLEQGRDIGHFGRLVFAMIARHFLEDEELVTLLMNDPSLDEARAEALVDQVNRRNYSPPKRERIVEWQTQQDFPICPHIDDPDEANVYRDLAFPEGVYERIEEYHEQKAEAEH